MLSLILLLTVLARAEVHALQTREGFPRLTIRPDSRYLIEKLTFLGNDQKKWFLCEGDCDQDSDCGDGLKCFQRDGWTPVPGCSGSGIEDVDYCYDPDWEETSAPTLEPTEQAMTSAPTLDPTEQAITPAPTLSLATSDPTSKPTLPPTLSLATSNPTSRPTLLPTMSPVTSNPTIKPTEQPTSYPTASPTVLLQTTEPTSTPIADDSDELIYVGDAREIGPLGRCMGHCRINADCRGDLECFEVEGATEVPGCIGIRMNEVGHCYDPLDEVTQDTTTAPVDPATSAPTATPTVQATSAPTAAPKTKIPTATSTLEPTAEPTVSQSTDVSIPIAPFVIELGFLTPSRRLASPEGVRDRQLLLNENINEEEELLGVVAKLVGNELRLLSPASYLGVLFRVTFLDEVESEGSTTLAYEFSGEARFKKGSDGPVPTASLVEDATKKALDNDAILNELSQSGDPVLEAVQSVSNPDAVSVQQEDSENNGIAIGIIAIVAVVAACAAVVGGAFIYLHKKKKQDVPISSKKSRSFESKEQHREGKGSANQSKISQMIGNLPSPAKTRSTNNESYEHFDDVESAVESSVPYEGSVFEASSIGGPRSDWSVDGDAVGYNSDDSSFNAGGPRLTQRRDINLADTVIALDQAQARAEVNDKSEVESVDGDVSTCTDNMSALGEVRLGSVLQLEGLPGHGTTADAEGGNENGQDFNDVWKKERQSGGDPEQEEQHVKKNKFGIRPFSTKAPPPKTQKGEDDPNLSLNNSADAEEVLKEMIGVFGGSPVEDRKEDQMPVGIDNNNGYPLPPSIFDEKDKASVSEANDEVASEAGSDNTGAIIGSILGSGSFDIESEDGGNSEEGKDLYVL